MRGNILTGIFRPHLLGHVQGVMCHGVRMAMFKSFKEAVSCSYRSSKAPTAECSGCCRPAKRHTLAVHGFAEERSCETQSLIARSKAPSEAPGAQMQSPSRFAPCHATAYHNTPKGSSCLVIASCCPGHGARGRVQEAGDLVSLTI